MKFTHQIKIALSLFTSWLCIGLSAQESITLSGLLLDKTAKTPLPFVSVQLLRQPDSAFVTGSISDEQGRFVLQATAAGSYSLQCSFLGFETQKIPVIIGVLNKHYDLGKIEMQPSATQLSEVTVEGKQASISGNMDKKTYTLADNLSQSGGSVLNSLQNLPGVTIDQNGKLLMRGSDKVIILIDGKQTSLTGFGAQKGLDNLPASAVERIEIINNPSAKYDANGMAGIVNIIYKKGKKAGFHGNAGMTLGVGEVGEKRANLPTIRDKYALTPKVNPSLGMNYKTDKLNLFFQGDILWQKRVNKNEFFERNYDDGRQVAQQYLENRTQFAYTTKGGLDYFFDPANSLSLSTLWSREGHIDRGDLPYFNAETNERIRLWTFYEDEVNTALNSALHFKHAFRQPGHYFDLAVLYTRAVEDEKYNFYDVSLLRTGTDTVFLLADERVSEFNADYVKPLKAGRLELGTKLRYRNIPVTYDIMPGENSVIDPLSGEWARWQEYVNAAYGNYVWESKSWEIEAGLRLEQTTQKYEVDPNHRVYRNAGYDYLRLFPNVRATWKLNDFNRISAFFNRRVDRPVEFDVRAFPKYDDPEILKTGNPFVRPQFTQTLEVAWKTSWEKGSFYAAVYHRNIDDIITRILTKADSNTLVINALPQNTGDGTNQGIELNFDQKLTSFWSLNCNFNAYKNVIEAYEIVNPYPYNVTFSGERQSNYTWNGKVNTQFTLPASWQIQLSGLYLAPDILPQGKIRERFSINFGIKKGIQKGKGELTLTGSDVFNTMRIEQELAGENFDLTSVDYYETQIFRVGYGYKF